MIQKSKLRERVLAGLLPGVVPALLVLLWFLVSHSGTVSPHMLPSPASVCAAFVTLIHTELLADIEVSARRAFTGFILGGGIAFALGLLNGLLRIGERLFDSTVHMARTIPHLAVIPILIMWFGIGEETKVLLVALGVFFPIYLNTFHGVRSVDPNLVETARSYGLRGVRLFREVIFPAATPSILIGFRHSLGVMWLTLIVAETVAADSGIGFITTQAREYMQMDVVVVGVLIYAFLGKGADIMARALEWTLLPWHPAHRGRR